MANYPGVHLVPEDESDAKVLGDIAATYVAPDYDDEESYSASIGSIVKKEFKVDGEGFAEITPNKKPPAKKSYSKSMKHFELKEEKVVVPTNDVSFKGIFGEIQAKYLNVYIEEDKILLVSSTTAGFNFIPPMSEEAITLTVNGDEYQAISIGMLLTLEEQQITVLVLMRV